MWKSKQDFKHLKKKDTHTPCGGGSDSERVAVLEAKVDVLIEKLKSFKSL